MNPPDWKRCTAEQLWHYLAWHLENAGIGSVLVGGAAVAIHDGVFNPMIPLKALTYFADGDLPTLPETVRQTLRNAAVAVKGIPELRRLTGGLADSA